MVINKDILLDRGWIEFDLKEYSHEHWESIHSKFNKEQAYNELRFFRIDGGFSEKISNEFTKYNSISCHTLNESVSAEDGYFMHSLWEGNIDELVEFKTDIEPKITKSFQYWFFNNKFSLNDAVERLYKQIAKELYPINETTIDKFHLDLSMYNKGCHIETHQDAQEDLKNRFCVILMYLNEDWSEGKGGELVIEGETLIEPTFGKIVILDFTHNNVNHSVNKVLDENFNRFATISFIFK